jgi:hypothetical protein
MDFKLFLLNKEGYNNLVIFIDRLLKKSVSILYKKTINAETLIELYI